MLEFKWSKEKRKEYVEAIQNYFLEEREEEIGELAANFLLDFFAKVIGPDIYNQGVMDSYKYLNERLEDLLALCNNDR